MTNICAQTTGDNRLRVTMRKHEPPATIPEKTGRAYRTNGSVRPVLDQSEQKPEYETISIREIWEHCVRKYAFTLSAMLGFAGGYATCILIGGIAKWMK